MRERQAGRTVAVGLKKAVTSLCTHQQPNLHLDRPEATFLLPRDRLHVNHTKKEYTRGDVHENRAECLFSLLKPYLRVFRGVSKFNLSGYVGFFQFLRNFRQRNAFEQAELILQAALDPTIASRAKKGEFVKYLDHFDLLQTAIN